MKYYLFLLLVSVFSSCVFSKTKKELNGGPLPKIVQIYPTSDTLPENLLRFYIHFSQAMKTMNNLENIKLVDNKGKEIEGAIFNNVYELWDDKQTQLTLILDPARVKTGLKANETLGRALEIGKSYQLIIEYAENIYGKPLEIPYAKKFFVQNADQEIPEIDDWKIIIPKTKTKSALQIAFSQSLDRLSVLNSIRLLNSKNEMVKGKIEIHNNEKEWWFIPYEKWGNDIYLLQINGRLEDPAGNNLNGLFDHVIGTLKNNEEGKIYELEIAIE